MKEWIKLHPLSFGSLMALGIFLVIVAIDTWFPYLDESLAHHQRLVQGLYFTFGAFVIWLATLWRWHRRPRFWISIGIFSILHVLGIVTYSTEVQTILVWQWVVLLIIESFLIVFFVYWATRPEQPA